METIGLRAKRFGDSLEHLLAGMERRKAVRGFIFGLLFVVMAASVYLLNLYMPLILDDYDFMYSWATGDLLTGFADVIRSQLVHYQIWGGRLLHVFTQSFLYLGKDAFNISNTAAFMLLLLEVYAIARPRERRFCWTILLLAYLALMTMLPFFGTVFLWLTGACIYLWGTLLALLPLVILRSIHEGGFFSQGRLSAALCLPIGILAGWTNENTTCGMIAVVFVMLACDYLKDKRLSARKLLLFAGQCVGAMLLLLAPGNFARASAYAYDSMIVELIRRFVYVTGYGMSYLGVLLALVILLAAGLRDKAPRMGYAFALVFASLVSVYAMVGSPELSDRTYTGPFVLMLCAALTLAGDGEVHAALLDGAKIAVLPLALVVMLYTGYHAVSDVQEYSDAWNSRVGMIEAACAADEKQVAIETVEANSRFTMDIALGQDAAQWPNSTISKYYGIDVIGL